jgi:amidase
VIRPAAFNGIVGFKPSYGAIPPMGVHPLSPSLDHIGFFVRRVDDVALGLSLLAAMSDDDRHGRPVPAFQVDLDQGIEPLDKARLGIVRFEKWSRAEPEQQKMFDTAIEKLRASGAVLEELTLAELDRVSWQAINTILPSEGALLFVELVARFPDRTSDHLKSLVTFRDVPYRDSCTAQIASKNSTPMALTGRWRSSTQHQ